MSIEAAAKAVNDGGWTCDLHEPEPFGDCQRCVDLQRQLVRNVLLAWAGDRVLYWHRSENSCLGCESDMNSCIDAFTNDLGKCCKACDHSEFVQLHPEVDDG